MTSMDKSPLIKFPNPSLPRPFGIRPRELNKYLTETRTAACPPPRIPFGDVAGGRYTASRRRRCRRRIDLLIKHTAPAAVMRRRGSRVLPNCLSPETRTLLLFIYFNTYMRIV